MKRRSFFKSFATAVAVIALAPEIAFNFRIKGRFGRQSNGIYEQLQYCMPHPLPATPANIDDFLNTLYVIKRERGEQSHIEIIVHEDWVPLLKNLL